MNKISSIRKQTGLTQSELAEKISQTQQNISNWESGKYEPDLKSLIDLSKVLNVTIEELLGIPIDKTIILSQEEYDGLIRTRDLINSIEKKQKIKNNAEINDNHGKKELK